MIKRERCPFAGKGVHAFGGGGGGTSTQTSTVKLPPEVSREIPRFIDFTRKFVGRKFKPFKGELVAGFNEDDLDYFNRVRGSEFLTERANPFFEEQLQRGRDRIGGEFTSRFGLGAFGGSAHQESLGRALGEFESGARGQEVERRRRERFAAEGRLSEIGNLQRQRQQQLLSAQYGQFLRRQDFPERQFNAYRDAIAALTGGAPRTTSTTTLTNQDTDTGTQVAQGLGTAASTASLGYLSYLLYTALAACWVARVLYGDTDSRTHAARMWVACNSNWFTRRYRKHGERWAAYLIRHPWQKPAWRLIWNIMVRKGFAMLKDSRRKLQVELCRIQD